MDSQTSRKIIVVSGMAVVVGIAVATFALRSHPAASVAQTAHPPTSASTLPADTPPPAAQIPPAPPAVAPIPDAPAAVAQIPAAPAAVAHSDSVGTKSADTATPSAVEHKLASNRHLAKAGTSAVATNGTVTRTGSAADTTEKPAAATAANSVDGVKSADELTPPPATASSPADDQKVGASTEFAALDSQITTDVKSEIAGDSLSKDVNIGVTTTHGVVALTGRLASQDAIDHVRDVAGKVKDVKSVDTSALILASL
jgi:hyperosmotically inducible periplasmic protein